MFPLILTPPKVHLAAPRGRGGWKITGCGTAMPRKATQDIGRVTCIRCLQKHYRGVVVVRDERVCDG